MSTCPNIVASLTRCLAVVLSIVTLSLMALTGCADSSDSRTPSLPEDFLNAHIPSIKFGVYYYANPGYPFKVQFPVVEEQLPANVGITKIAYAIHSDAQSRAIQIQFQESGVAVATELLLRIAKGLNTEGEFSLGVIKREAKNLSVVLRDVTQTGELNQAYISRSSETIKESHPEIWSSLLLLPSNPPAKPIAAGFVQNIGQVSEGFLAEQDLSFINISGPIGLARIKNIAFAIYSNNSEYLSTSMNLTALAPDTGVVIVGKSDYPGLLVSLVSGILARRAGFEETLIKGEKAYYRKLNDTTHLVLVNFDNVFYMNLSPARELSEQLAGSIISDNF